MKKFLSALVALSIVVAPTGNICKAESLTASIEKQANKEQKSELLKKASSAVKSFKEVVREHGKEIGLGVVGAASAGVVTWNGYNLVKNTDKLKEILADSELSIPGKVSAIAKLMFCGVAATAKKTQETMTAEEATTAEAAKGEKAEAEKNAEDVKKAEKATTAEADKKAKEEPKKK